MMPHPVRLSPGSIPMIRTLAMCMHTAYHHHDYLAAGRKLLFHPDLAGDRTGIAHLLHIEQLIAELKLVEIAGEHAVAMEIEEAALLVHEEAEVLLLRKLGYLAQELVLDITPAIAGRPIA